jgi:hypothetical protein
MEIAMSKDQGSVRDVTVTHVSRTDERVFGFGFDRETGETYYIPSPLFQVLGDAVAEGDELRAVIRDEIVTGHTHRAVLRLAPGQMVVDTAAAGLSLNELSEKAPTVPHGRTASIQIPEALWKAAKRRALETNLGMRDVGREMAYLYFMTVGAPYLKGDDD